MKFTWKAEQSHPMATQTLPSLGHHKTQDTADSSGQCTAGHGDCTTQRIELYSLIMFLKPVQEALGKE